MAFLLSALLQSLGSFSEPQNEKVADKFKARSWPPLDMAHVIPIIGIVSPHNPVVSFSTIAPVSPCRGRCVSIRLVLRPGQLHASPLLLLLVALERLLHQPSCPAVPASPGAAAKHHRKTQSDLISY